MSKKTIIIISTVLGLLLIFLVVYFLFFQSGPSTPGGIISGFKSFFPFGGDNLPPPTPTSEPTPTPTPTHTPNTDFTQKLRKLSTNPVAGAGIVDTKAGSVVRYIEKATGHIFEIELFSPKQGRISNTTIPVVYNAIWGNKNNSLVSQYLKDDNRTIDTYSLAIKELSTTTENIVSGVALPLNVNQVSALGDSIFYLEQLKDSSAGYISKFDGSSKKQIWNSPLSELLSQYVNTKIIALTTKPLSDVAGYLYFVDATTGQVKKILGDILGLATLVNGSASQVLYLNQENSISLNLFNSKDNSRTNISPTTFPEKCVWSKKDESIVYCAVPKGSLNGESLTNWYKGFILYSDDIWKYDLKNNTSNIIEDLNSDSGENIDVIKPILSENEQYLVFMNKLDNFLWSLDLTK
ncbi:MAG: hypothetical protein WAX85_01860 [Minisyncoccia bacterium]